MGSGRRRKAPPWNFGRSALCFRLEEYDFAFKIEESTSREPIPDGKRLPRTYGRSRGDDWYLAPTGKLTREGRGPGYEPLSLRDGKEPIDGRLEELVIRMYEVIAGQREADRIKAVREERTIAYLRKKDERRRLEEFEARRRRLSVIDLHEAADQTSRVSHWVRPPVLDRLCQRRAGYSYTVCVLIQLCYTRSDLGSKLDSERLDAPEASRPGFLIVDGS